MNLMDSLTVIVFIVGLTLLIGVVLYGEMTK